MKPRSTCSFFQAALTGDGVYNFGEVLCTPILEALDDTPNAWLGGLLRIFARGDIDAFNAVLAERQTQYLAQPAIARRLLPQVYDREFDVRCLRAG